MLLLAAALVAAGPSAVPTTQASRVPVVLTSRNWHLAQRGYWLVKFHAPWCGHCKRMAPAYKSVAEHFHSLDAEPAVHIGKVDGTKEPDIQSKFGVQGYPTLLLLKNGKKAATFSGERNFEGIAAFVRKHAKQRAREDGGADAPAKGGRRGGATKRAPGARALAKSTRRLWEKMRKKTFGALTEHRPVDVGMGAFAVASSLAFGLFIMIVFTAPRATRS